MPQRQVTESVDGIACNVWVVKTGSTTWRAYGEFQGRHIGVMGRSDTQALDTWRRSANYAANE